MFAFFFIIGTSDVAEFDVLSGVPICLRSSSGEGIPGVGVTPGFTGFFSSSGLGIPGVGVAPFGILAITAGMPGVDAFDGGTGEVESPGGRFTGSTLTKALLFVLMLLFEILFAGAEPPQPNAAIDDANKPAVINFVNIYKSLAIFNIVMPVRRLRPRRAATASEPARVGFFFTFNSSFRVKRLVRMNYRTCGELVNTFLPNRVERSAYLTT